MADGLVTEVLSQLALIAMREVQQRINLVKNADKEVIRLQGNLELVKGVLKDAEKKQATNEAVKIWLQKLEDMCYKMSDVVDDWNTAMIRFEIQKDEEQNAEKDKKKKVCFSILSPSCCFRQVNKVIIRKDIAAKIIALDGEFNEIVKLKNDFNFELNTGNATEVVAGPENSSLFDVSTIVGRDEDGNKLLRILLGNDSEVESHRVISLVGIGGIGKTALAQLVYSRVETHFEPRIWVPVSGPFDQCKVKVAKVIFKELEGRYPDINEWESLLKGIYKLVEGKKFFLVLDDVWNIVPEVWDSLKYVLNKGDKDSRILVTTREVMVAQKMNSTSECTIHLKGFSDKDCWLMLSKTVFLESDREREELKDLGMQIAKKCNGFPLAAKDLGIRMRHERSKEHWKKVLDEDLCKLDPIKPLLLSYNNLSSPLKQCFSFCAIFPKDYVISVDEMIYMWMANGYIDLEENMEMANLATKYFDDLAIFFRDFEKDKDNMLTSCKMHNIVHEFARSITKNECITIDSDKVSNYVNARHLRLEIPGEEAQFPESIYTAKNLRTLILEVERDYDLSRLFEEFTSLRSLTLKCQSKKLLNDLGKCIHLRFLNLYDYGAYELPETICDLCNLQILKIYSSRHFGLKKLPQGMGKLIKLRYLILDRELEFPSGIGRLTSLRRLSHFSICDKDDSKGCKLGELKNLNNLKGTLQIGGLGNVLDECEAKNALLKKKIGLRTLQLLFYGENDKRRENDASILNALESPPNLEYLSIEWYLGTKISHKWTMSLTQLKTLQLLYCIDLEHLPSLGKLPYLESLSIGNANTLKKVGDEFLGIDLKNKKDSIIEIFPYLKSLKFHTLFEWEEWIGNGRMRGGEEEEDCIIMPKLKQLAIFHCGKLKSLPAFLCTTTSLEKLDIELSPILSKHCQENWSKISHIPNIQINQKYVQRDGEEVN